ncbi:kinase-like protein [Hyphopichia burtonii NRRL Y-1933]|uniref:non-specific serine/threonine protein kinase n=1 Tax=Hyphopichia burtonii NRRL Y-1933 TaxID=984485 RepID=A0A1E4RS67_9ASCO|nr:kinase-like protein [Hyphopichia burtonii NRRL Y-1933]ODV70122.1 kinase-like protein [Hyphopichia burtonii NRRL Y-1933]
MSSISHYKRTEVIGRGKFGVVYKGFHKQTKQVVAIKVLNLDTQEDEVADVQQEIQFLTDLKTVPNVTHYYGSILNDTKLWIIMDYCAGGSVRTLLKAGIFEERYIAVIVRECLTALQAVHKLGVIHRDLKSANILITNEGNVQLCDFGVAAKVTSSSVKRTTMAGTPYWMAPEVIREGDQYDSKADIWSLGITIYEIATGNPPYCDKDAMWAMQMISKLTPPRLEGREYSAALKECIALCLDESPVERPSADDLQKCKLMKFYRNYPTSILKEIISKYLLWRDKNSSRESVFLNLNDDLQQTQDSPGNDNTNLQVKWDFDSLSSREYIIDNDISMNKVTDSYDGEDGFKSPQDPNTDTLRQEGYSNRYNSSKNSTINLNRYNDQSNNATYPNQNTQNTNTYHQTIKASSEIPKSLQSLFEENSPEINPLPSTISSKDFELPTSFANLNDNRVESPTIEIPDMDNLANFASKNLNQANGTTSNPSNHQLSRPPALHHSQSASAALESRSSANSTMNRPRKLTISNTASSSISNLSNQESLHSQDSPLVPDPQQQQQAMPHTPPYTSNHIHSKTPSPAPPPSSALLHEASGANTGSPSKSMRALHSNNNPLLQPINMKLPESSNLTAYSSKSTNDAPSSGSTTNPPSTSSTAAPTNHPKPRKGKPSLHIQMPTPSTTFNSLSALTNNEYEQDVNNENTDSAVNQFGVSISQLTNFPMTMTPVAERENPAEEHAHQNRERTESTSSIGQRHFTTNIQTQQVQGQKKSASNSAPNTAPITTNTTGSNLFLPRTTSLGGTSPSSATVVSKTKFPLIPAINPEFFMDTVPKDKLISELDSMIKSFNQGLDALEDGL